MSTAPASGPGRDVVLVASGDLRLSANQRCWPAQAAMETPSAPRSPTRAHASSAHIRTTPRRTARLHRLADARGWRSSATSIRDAPLIVAEAVWQYSHHVLPGCTTHRGPILTVANWTGTWPGLVGMLNLNGSLTKAGVKYRTLWSEDFTDGLRARMHPALARERAGSSTTAATPARSTTGRSASSSRPTASRGSRSARRCSRDKAIMGVFDEGCMGMFNAIIPDELLHPDRRLQGAAQPVGALLRRCTQVSDDEAARRPPVAGRARACSSSIGPGRSDRPDRRSRSSSSARCTSPPCASPTTSAATRSASSTSRA